MPRSRTLALIVGGVAALAITGAAMAHPGLGLVDRVDVLARALGISSEEVQQAKDDGSLRDLVGDLTLDDLTNAYEAEAGEAIDEALADGEITPEQAERLGEFRANPRGFGRFGGAEGFDREAFEGLRAASMAVQVDRLAVFADVLGLTTDEVEAAIEDHSIRDLLTDVDPVVLAAALVDAQDAAIDAALTGGDITAEQAELLRDSGAGGFGRFQMRGGFRGHGHGFGHGLRQAPQADDVSTTSSTGISV
jgi:hypothetical protein